MQAANDSDSEDLIEKECRQAFIDRLQQAGAQTIIWKRQDRQQTPDYEFEVDNRAFGLEVTSIWHNLEFNSNETQSERGIGPIFQSFAREVKKQAISEGILNGSYELSCSPPKDFKETKKETITGIMDALRRLESKPIGSRTDVVVNHQSRIRVRKVGISPNELILRSHSSGKGGFANDVSSQFWNAVQLAVEKKAKKRELIERESPVTLLLYDGYRMATPDIFLNVPTGMALWCPFSEVYLIHFGKVFQLKFANRVGN